MVRYVILMNHKSSDKNLTQLIRYMREASGFSQKDLANRLGIAQTTLSGYETGYSEPNFTLIQKIAEICDFDILFLDKTSNVMYRISSGKND